MYPVWQERLIRIDTLPLLYSLVAVDMALFAFAIRTKLVNYFPQDLSPIGKDTGSPRGPRYTRGTTKS